MSGWPVWPKDIGVRLAAVRESFHNPVKSSTESVSMSIASVKFLVCAAAAGGFRQGGVFVVGPIPRRAGARCICAVMNERRLNKGKVMGIRFCAHQKASGGGAGCGRGSDRVSVRTGTRSAGGPDLEGDSVRAGTRHIRGSEPWVDRDRGWTGAVDGRARRWTGTADVSEPLMGRHRGWTGIVGGPGPRMYLNRR